MVGGLYEDLQMMTNPPESPTPPPSGQALTRRLNAELVSHLSVLVENQPGFFFLETWYVL